MRQRTLESENTEQDDRQAKTYDMCRARQITRIQRENVEVESILEHILQETSRVGEIKAEGTVCEPYPRRERSTSALEDDRTELSSKPARDIL